MKITTTRLQTGHYQIVDTLGEVTGQIVSLKTAREYGWDDVTDKWTVLSLDGEIQTGHTTKRDALERQYS